MEMTRRGLLGGLAAVGVVGVLAPSDLLVGAPVEAPTEEVWVMVPYQDVHDEVSFATILMGKEAYFASELYLNGVLPPRTGS